jgi:hypothetical protein
MPANRSNLTIIAAAAFAGLGAVWALKSAGCLSRANPPPTAITDTAAVENLNAISEFLEPADDAERAALASEVRETILTRTAERKSVPDERDRLLARLVEERIALILSPDYDRYLDQITAWTGRNASEAIKGTMFENRELWTAFANAGASAAIAPEGVLIRTASESLADPDSLAGGYRATLEDPGYYGTAPLIAAGAEVRDVVIPMVVYSAEHPKGLLVYATIGFVWDANRSTWLPYKTGVQDPTGENAVTALWI